MGTYELANEAASFIKQKTGLKRPIAIVLGTGLGALTTRIEISTSIPYSDIPHFPLSTVAGHDGKLIYGTLNGVEVLAMKGRFHFYEGYSMQQVTFPIRVMQLIGIKSLILSNASGGMNPDFNVGDVMIIRDHINLFPTNPLIGQNDSRLGPRFPDMSETYDISYVSTLKNLASELGLNFHTGVYAGLSGPTFETPSEYKYLRIIGADNVGMSTVPEAIVAKHAGMRVAAISIITDLGVEGHVEKVSHEEVLKAANEAEPKLAKLIFNFVKKISDNN